MPEKLLIFDDLQTILKVSKEGEAMSVEEAVLEKLQCLPADKKQEVLNFVEFLLQKMPNSEKRQNLKGLWKDNVNITEEDIAEARKEMWSNFGDEDNL